MQQKRQRKITWVPISKINTHNYIVTSYVTTISSIRAHKTVVSIRGYAEDIAYTLEGFDTKTYTSEAELLDAIQGELINQLWLDDNEDEPE